MQASRSNNNGGALNEPFEVEVDALLANQKAKGRLIAERHGKGGGAFIGDERHCYARASALLTDLAYHWPPRGVLIPRALRASAILMKGRGACALSIPTIQGQVVDQI
jgi:hypothetical protein